MTHVSHGRLLMFFFGYMVHYNSGNFQSVVLHITQCKTSDINHHLSNRVNATFQKLKHESEKSKIVYNNVLTSLSD
jgi:hypothetical protein